MQIVGFSSQHLQEANTASTFGEGAQIEIQLGHLCNNRCVFCVSGQMTEERIARLVPLDPVRRALEQGAARGARRVTFLGGEPTIQRSFLPAVALARDLGYDDIVVFTNGVRLQQRGFLDDVLRHGDFTWRISIQGGNEAAHVAVTGRPASFRRILTGMERLRERGQEITANLCLNRLNAASLPDFVPLVQRFGIRQLHVDLMRPQDAGARTDAWLLETMGRYQDMAPAIEAMLEGFEAADPGFDVNIGNLPYCVLPGWADRIHHGGEQTQTFAANGQGQIDAPWDKYEHQRSDKVHRADCERCAFRGRCSGVFDRYVEAHGWGEFEPVTLGELPARDPRLGAFDLHAMRWVEPLLDGPLPLGWSLVERRHEARDRRLDVVLGGPSGVATISLHPPSGSPRPTRVSGLVLQGPELRLALAWDGSTADRDTLLRWLRGRLAELGVRLESPGDTQRRSLDRLLRLVRGVRARPEQGAWTLSGVESVDGGVDLRFLGPQPLLVRARRVPGRAAPRLELVGDGLDPEGLRPLLTTLQGLARGDQPGGATRQ